METALVVPTGEFQSLGQKVMTAAEFEKLVKFNPEILENVELQHQQNKTPIVFRQKHSRRGNLEKISACFAHASGYAPIEDHIFKSNNGYKNIDEAIAGKAKIILSLNMNLSYLSLDFRAASDPSILSEVDFKYQNPNYYMVSVKNLPDAIQAIKKSSEAGATLNQDVVALYRGAVLPYREFYLGNREDDIMKLYKNMEERVSGIQVGNTRNVGFPRIFLVSATGTTIQQKATKGAKVNYIRRNDKALFSQLVFPDASKIEKRMATKEAWEIMLESNGEAYVIASPSISLDVKESGFLRQMRLVVTNLNRQVAPIKNPQRLEQTRPAFERKLAKV